MLVFTRKSKESVVVGSANPLEQMLRVTVLEIGRGKVRLGFEADSAVPVHRSEVWERIRANTVRPVGATVTLAAPATG